MWDINLIWLDFLNGLHQSIIKLITRYFFKSHGRKVQKECFFYAKEMISFTTLFSSLFNKLFSK